MPISVTEILDLLLRGGTAGMSVGMAIIFFRQQLFATRLAGGLFYLGVAGYALAESTIVMQVFGPFGFPFWLFYVASSGLFWVFAVEFFCDEHPLRITRYLPTLFLVALAALAAVIPGRAGEMLWLIHTSVSAALMGHVLWITWSGLGGDLVESRRRVRGPLIAVSAAYSLVICGVHIAHHFTDSLGQLSLLSAATVFALSMAGVMLFTGSSSELFAESLACQPEALASPPQSPTVQSESKSISVQDGATLKRLLEAMDENEIWRRESLTIGELAQLVGTPEHRLRKIINEGLGYRNFAAFVSERRIAAARAALADADQARKPVSAIAFAVGFNSLASFNRVFREMTGMTPTTYRNRALLEGADADQKQTA